MLNNYDVFLFDFDGTLFDTLESSIYVFEEAYRRKGMSIEREKILGYTREPIPVSYKKEVGSLIGYDRFIKDIDELVFSQKVVDMTEIYDDTLSTLTYLKEHKKVVGIVTSNAKEHVLDVLRKYDMENMFDIIVGNREAPNPKPSPEPIEKALELIKYKGDLSKVVYVGDSLNDVKAAVNAKIKPILLDRLDEFDEYKDRFEVIKSLDEIKR